MLPADSVFAHASQAELSRPLTTSTYFAHLSRRRDEGFEATFADQVMKLSMAALCLGDLRTPVR
jgi:hypothetical protein